MRISCLALAVDQPGCSLCKVVSRASAEPPADYVADHRCEALTVQTPVCQHYFAHQGFLAKRVRNTGSGPKHSTFHVPTPLTMRAMMMRKVRTGMVVVMPVVA